MQQLSGAFAYFIDPSIPAKLAHLFWEPRLFARCLTLISDPLSLPFDFHTLNLTDLKCRSSVLKINDRRHLIGFSESNFCLQMDCYGPFQVRKSLNFSLAFLKHMDLVQQVVAIQRLMSLLDGNIPKTQIPAKLVRKYATYLLALDAEVAGASQKEIAELLFGIPLIESDWRGTSDYLRARVRRIIARAKVMRDGGYMDFLK